MAKNVKYYYLVVRDRHGRVGNPIHDVVIIRKTTDVNGIVEIVWHNETFRNFENELTGCIRNRYKIPTSVGVYKIERSCIDLIYSED